MMNEDRIHEEQTKPVGKPCIAFDMDSAEEAVEHWKLKPAEDYGDRQYGHDLYVWDEGCRVLFRCEACGGYVLRQSSVYDRFPFGGEDHYDDYFPVSGPEEADELNRKYDGFAIEREFPGRYLMKTNGKIHWSVMNERAKEAEDHTAAGSKLPKGTGFAAPAEGVVVPDEVNEKENPDGTVSFFYPDGTKWQP